MTYRRLILGFVVFLAVSMLLFGQAKNFRPATVRDPVCGLSVEKDPELSAVYKSQTYYFCTKTDRDKFKKTPQDYVK